MIDSMIKMMYGSIDASKSDFWLMESPCGIRGRKKAPATLKNHVEHSAAAGARFRPNEA